MNTTVVNKYHKVPYDIYIGRGSIWGNPFVIGRDGDRNEVIIKYEKYVRNNKFLMSKLHELKGKILCCYCSPLPCHGHVLIKLIIEFTKDDQMKILECSSKGDKRFSAFYARVSAWGKMDSIENHYQLSKRFDNEKAPTNWKDAKGKTATHMSLNGTEYELKYLSQWYKMLWVEYLDSNPDLVEYASSFDEYNDIFKGKSMNCQADVIRQYIKEGRESLVKEYTELMDLFLKGD